MGKHLSNREKEILQLIQQEGLTNQEIAERLETSKKTVEGQIRNILLKYNVKNRVQAIFKGLKLADIELKEPEPHENN